MMSANVAPTLGGPSCRMGAPGSSACSTSKTAGSGSYSTSIRPSASIAVSSSTAATATDPVTRSQASIIGTLLPIATPTTSYRPLPLPILPASDPSPSTPFPKRLFDRAPNEDAYHLLSIPGRPSHVGQRLDRCGIALG